MNHAADQSIGAFHTSHISAPQSTRSRAGLVAVVALHVVVIGLLATAAREIIPVAKPTTTVMIPPLRPPEPIKPPEPPPRVRTPERVLPTPAHPPTPILDPTPLTPISEVVTTSETAIALPAGDVIAAPSVLQTTTTPSSGVVSAGLACTNVREIQESMCYPREARREGAAGEVLVRFTLTTRGEIRNAHVVTSPHRELGRAAISAVQQFRCHPSTEDVVVEAPFAFRLGD
jgi:TonB family protein